VGKIPVKVVGSRILKGGPIMEDWQKFVRIVKMEKKKIRREPSIERYEGPPKTSRGGK